MSDEGEKVVSTGSTTGASSATGVSSLAGAFFAAAFLVTASVAGSWLESLRASLNRSALDFLGSATFSVPSVPGRPLNFCQSPVTFSRASTASVGCAPTDSQCCARSELTSMNEGSAFG